MEECIAGDGGGGWGEGVGGLGKSCAHQMETI